MAISALIVSILSLIVAALAAIFARSSSKKANEISNENLSLTHGMLELELRQSVENSKAKLSEVGLVMAPLKSREDKGSISEEDLATLDIYTKILDSSIQTMLNVYEDACTKYLDSKVDKIRFKKSFHIEVRNLLERDEMKEYFDPLTSRYKGILKVYDEWENLEK